jgi:catechol 2,3-dioxygenase-like lactoylglutathione lyase family enzyme
MPALDQSSLSDRWRRRRLDPHLTASIATPYRPFVPVGRIGVSPKGPGPPAENLSRTPPMTDLDTYRKQAKLLVRWRREGNASLGGRVRQLPRYRSLSDRDVLAMEFPLALAQEIIAVEAGYASWAALKHAVGDAPSAPRAPAPALRLKAAVPVLYVRDVTASAHFYRDRLGFQIDFLHGLPAFYGAVSRDGAGLHLKFVHEAVFGPGRVEEEGLIMAFVPVDNLKALFAEFQAKGVPIVQAPTKQAWGGTDFHVQDLDGNRICFVQ